MKTYGIDQLNEDFSLDGQLRFVEGRGGFPWIEIDNGEAQALISTYGGQVLTYRPKDTAEDLLFLSEKAYFQAGKAIKGGIPICWPWFGPDPDAQGRPSHGLVRTHIWTVKAAEATPEGDTRVVLEIKNDEQFEKSWPYPFRLQLDVSVGPFLTVKLITRNTGDRSFSITQALHSYFKIGDIDKVRVLGLDKLPYLDKVDAGVKKIQAGDVIVSEEVDRIYTGVQDDLTIDDPVLERRINISSIGSRTTVVWNPWSEIAKQMGDLDDDDYRRFICVETANAADEVVEIPTGGESRLIVRYGIS
jgi:glucose-6-phosphate 1-epimerase